MPKRQQARRTGGERDELVLDNLALAHHVVNRMGLAGHRLRDDFVAEAYKALSRAADLFDPSLGVRFSTYATCSIQRVVQRALAVSARAESVGVAAGGRDAAGDPLQDLLAQDESGTPDLAEALDVALAALHWRTAKVLRLRFLDGLTLREVAALLGVSRERVRQLERAGLARLRQEPALLAIFDCGGRER